MHESLLSAGDSAQTEESCPPEGYGLRRPEWAALKSSPAARFVSVALDPPASQFPEISVDTAGFPSLGTTDIGAGEFFIVKAVLCFV